MVILLWCLDILAETNRLSFDFQPKEYDLSVGFKTVDFLENRLLINEHTNDDDGSSLAYRGAKSGAENYYKKISG